jgi:hypothetical protein
MPVQCSADPRADATDVLWFPSTHGDSHFRGSEEGARQMSQELVFPKLPLNATTGNDITPARNSGLFGEVIANVAAPSQLSRASAS